MGKKIESPVERFSGHVIIADPMTMPQVLAIEESLIKSNVFFDDKKDKEGRRFLKRNAMTGMLDSEAIRGIMPCVEEWHLGNIPENVSAENFPFTPRPASHELIQWLLDEILKIYLGEIEVPNE